MRGEGGDAKASARSITFRTGSPPGTNSLWITMISGHGLCSEPFLALLVFHRARPSLPSAGMADQTRKGPTCRDGNLVCQGDGQGQISRPPASQVSFVGCWLGVVGAGQAAPLHSCRFLIPSPVTVLDDFHDFDGIHFG
jgi:hypothetical protein